jgi:predicted XRE-type DNA-binding protein
MDIILSMSEHIKPLQWVGSSKSWSWCAGACHRSKKMTKIEAGSTNVYQDLGLPDAAEMQVKATLAAKIGEIIKHRHLTQIEAAEILGMPQPKLSGMLRGQFRGISEVKMLECLNRLGRDVQIVVRKPSRSRVTGRTSVVFA